MKEWSVQIPISGVIHVLVEAEDEGAAIDAAFDSEWPDRPEEWEGHRYLVRGNTCSAWCTEANAEEIQDMGSDRRPSESNTPQVSPPQDSTRTPGPAGAMTQPQRSTR